MRDLEYYEQRLEQEIAENKRLKALLDSERDRSLKLVEALERISREYWNEDAREALTKHRASQAGKDEE